ncbi:MAG: glycerol-3-phosphate 1-O-acyltransferase PlsY [Deltaproteobacteria bacterium]|nr:glycerol-3-phosphate 1-O-acyltransferase PlsY [Deltaproteobacteria bacterium]
MGLAVFGYLLGSVPCGLVLARLTGAPDPRKVGSGNIGATNVLRSGGKALGITTLLLDILKGLIPTLIASRVLDNPIAICLVGFLAFLGHLFPLYLKFKGGKGVATAIGVMMILMPKALGLSLLCFLVAAFLTRMVSVGSITAAALLPFWGWIFGYSRSYLVLACVMAALIIYRHKANIKRILNGTESRLGKRKKGEN